MKTKRKPQIQASLRRIELRSIEARPLGISAEVFKRIKRKDAKAQGEHFELSNLKTGI